MSEGTDHLAECVAMIRAHAEKRGQPIVLRASPADVEEVRARLLRAGAPAEAFIVEPGERPAPVDPLKSLDPKTRVRIAMMIAEAQGNDPYRLARQTHAEVNRMLGQYRHNDPAVAAQIRAERMAKRAARGQGRQP